MESHSKKVDLNPRKTLEGGAFIKHVLKKGGKNQGPLLISDLDEEALQHRLSLLLKELQEYKDRVERYKKDNAWYREEIATSQRDTEDYIRYLESKKNEKLDAVHRLAESNKQDLERFMEMKSKHEQEHNSKITELKERIFELEEKLNSKEHEFLQLSDTIAKRARHYEELSKIKEEIKNAEVQHQEEVLKLEKSLLDTRMKLQVESDEKVKMMESEAEQKAAKYLADHTAQIERENRQLQQELTKLTMKTSRLIAKRDQLIQENQELERQQTISNDLIRLRLDKMKIAEEKQERRKQKRQLILTKQRERFMNRLQELKGLGMDEEAMEKIALGDWQDVDSDDD